jgi:hypothetical protein
MVDLVVKTDFAAVVTDDERVAVLEAVVVAAEAGADAGTPLVAQGTVVDCL